MIFFRSMKEKLKTKKRHPAHLHLSSDTPFIGEVQPLLSPLTRLKGNQRQS